METISLNAAFTIATIWGGITFVAGLFLGARLAIKRCKEHMGNVLRQIKEIK